MPLHYSLCCGPGASFVTTWLNGKIAPAPTGSPRLQLSAYYQKQHIKSSSRTSSCCCTCTQAQSFAWRVSECSCHHHTNHPFACWAYRANLALGVINNFIPWCVLLAAVIPKLKDLYGRFLDAYNVHLIVTPTTHLPAGPIDQVQPWVRYNGKLVDTFDAYGQTVFLGPPLGVPAINIPIGLSSDGLPLGIHFQARPGETHNPCSVSLSVG